MSTYISVTGPRAYAALATLALATSGLVAVSTAADSAPATPATIEVDTASEYERAVLDASEDATQAHTIVLGTDIALESDEDTRYTGTTDLTIDGAGHTVTGAGSPLESFTQWDGTFLSVLPADQHNPAEPFAPHITISDVTVSDFVTVGAIRSATAGTLTVEDSTFHQNANSFEFGSGYGDGGAISARGDVDVTRSTFTSNSAAYGGGIGIQWDVHVSPAPPALDVQNSTFTENTAVEGGAISVDGALTVSATDFGSNTGARGGAVNASGTVTIGGATFDSNVASTVSGSSDFGSGGALWVNGDVNVSTSTFNANSAGYGGAIDYGVPSSSSLPDATSQLEVDTSTFSGNTAGNVAGAIAINSLAGAPTRISNSTFAANTVAMLGSPEPTFAYGIVAPATAGAIAGYKPATSGPPEEPNSLSLVMSTFSGNTGGDAAHIALAVETVGEDDATFAANAFNSADQVLCAVSSTTVTTESNFDADGSCTGDWSGDGDIGDGLDTMLGALADNGGATQTMLPQAGSPLIDSAALADGACAVDADQRGTARPQGDGCDIGSVEIEVEVGNEDGAGDGDGAGDEEGGALEVEADEPVAPTPTPTAPASECTDIAFQIKTDKGMIDAVAHCATSVGNIKWTAAADVTSAPPAGLVLPLGVASFDVAVANAGDSATIDLTLPLAVSQLWKVTDGDWARVADATIDSAGTGLTYTLTDGGAGDEDGQANAVIVDPIAPAVGAAFTG